MHKKLLICTNFKPWSFRAWQSHLLPFLSKALGFAPLATILLFGCILFLKAYHVFQIHFHFASPDGGTQEVG